MPLHFRSFGPTAGIIVLLAFLVLMTLPLGAAPARLSLGTYFGGGSDDTVLAVASDSSGVYLTGKTYSVNLPGTSGPLNGSNDLFVAKLSRDGARLLWSVRIGGSQGEEGRAIVSDGKGAVYITGSTSSPDFPTTPGVEQRSFGGFDDVIVLRLNAATGAVNWSTYFGQDNLDEGNGIALDGQGGVLVAGWWAQNDAVVLKFEAATGVGIWGRAWSQRDEAKANDLAIDAQGNIWVTGTNDAPGTESGFEIVGPALQASCGAGDAAGSCGPDAFLTKLSADGQTILYSSLLGGSFDDSAIGNGRDEGHAIAIDEQGNILVAGKTFAGNFPTKNALQATKAGAANFSDGFLTKVSPDGSAILFSTYLGGTAWDEARALALDEQGNITLSGFTASADFPLAEPFQGAIGPGTCELGGFERSCYDAFVTRVSPAGALLQSSFLGGGADDFGYGIVADDDGLLVAGTTESMRGIPLTPGAFQGQKALGPDGFLVQFGAVGGGPPPGPYRVYLPLLRR